MDSLIKIYLRLLQETDEKTFRYLYHNIDWNERCVAIIGAKGVGKTTPSSTFYFYMNWGWGVGFNGWYYNNNIVSPKGNYQYNRQNLYISK